MGAVAPGLARYDAVVLAGGSARRLGGVDKTALVLDGTTLLDRVLAALGDARTIVVVGPRRDTARPVEWIREELPGTGPVAALRAGLSAITAPWVAVLAADLPFLTASDVIALRVAAAPSEGALLVDDTGREQYLAALWRTAVLRGALASYDGTSMRGLVALLLTARVPACEWRAGVDRPPPWYDVDTQADLDLARGWA